MKPVNSLDAVAELIRRKTSAELALKKNNNQSIQKKLTQNVANVQSKSALKAKVLESIKQIDKTDSNKEKKSMAILVENAILWQFGDDLVNDPAFSDLVDNVVDSMRQEPQIAKLLSKLL